MRNPHLTGDIARAKKLFPDMPGYVFDHWITELIEVHEHWPFRALQDFVSPPWDQYFCNLTLVELSQLQWKLESLAFRAESLHRDAAKSLIDMVAAHCSPNPAQFKIAERSEDRWQRIVEFTKKERSILPCPVVLLGPLDNLRIFDGHHRLSIYLLEFGDGFTVDAWIGQPPLQARE